jgi:dihydroorotase-like cyclic amidohydrolase
MLFVVLQDMEDELIRIGSGRSRGLGQIKAEISQQEKNGRHGGVTTSTIRKSTELATKSAEPVNELWGLGRWLNDGSYGTRTDDWLPAPESVERTDRGIRCQRVFTGDALTALRDATIDRFIKNIQTWSTEDKAETAFNK